MEWVAVPFSRGLGANYALGSVGWEDPLSNKFDSFPF